MSRIYQFLEVPYYSHDFDNIEQITQEDDEVYGIYGDHKIKNRLELPPSEAKKILGADVCDIIYKNYDWYFNKYNYRK
jgi:sulfotransferase